MLKEIFTGCAASVACFLALSFNHTYALRPISEADAVEKLADGIPVEKNIYKLAQENVLEKRHNKAIWTNLGWRAQLGSIGRRFDDQFDQATRNVFGENGRWSHLFNYMQENNVVSVLNRTPREKWGKVIENFSPIEKYDLLFAIVDPVTNKIMIPTTLTRKNWDILLGFYTSNKGKGIEDWFGVCEGETGFSIYARDREPRKKVTIATRVPGLSITFLPRDIKGLGALAFHHMFASDPGDPTPSRGFTLPFLGFGSERDFQHQKLGPAGEQLVDAEFDVNPASVILALTNFVGIRDELVVIDEDPQRPIWNRIVGRYAIQIVGKDGKKQTGSLEDALIPYHASEDKYRAHRHPDTAYLLKFRLKFWAANTSDFHVAYSNGNVPATADETEKNTSGDLEISQEGEILGGEWHQQYHPDMLWKLPRGFTPYSKPEIRSRLAGAWQNGAPIPDEWMEPGEEAAKGFEVLWGVVDQLVTWSEKEPR